MAAKKKTSDVSAGNGVAVKAAGGFDHDGVSDDFRVAGEPSRLKILFALWAGKEMNVSDICGLLECTQPAVSHHLALLRGRRFVTARRSGKCRYYTLTPKGRKATEAAEVFGEG